MADYNFLRSLVYNSHAFYRLDRPWYNAKKLFRQKSSGLGGQKISQAQKLQLESFLSLDLNKCFGFRKRFYLQNEILREL